MGNSLTGKVKARKAGIDGTAKSLKDGAVAVEVEFRYRLDGKTQVVYIGSYPNISLKEVNDRRDRLHVKIRDGENPKGEIKVKRAQNQAIIAQDIAESERVKQEAINDAERIRADVAARQARVTVVEFFNTWQALELCRRKDKGVDALRMFTKDVFPVIGEMALEDVKRANIQSIIDSITMRGVVRMNKSVLSELRQMFNFAVDREILEADPTARIKKKSLGKDNERERVLSNQEIIELFKRFQLTSIPNRRTEAVLMVDEVTQLALKIQFATMTRIGEVLGAKWHDVDLNERTWRIPDTKNGVAHEVYLSDWAIKQIKRLREITGGVATFLFASTRTGEHVCSKTVTKQVADRQRGDKAPMSGRTQNTSVLLLDGGQWRPHDLRRTGATMCASLGILPEVVEKCLNHVEQSKVKRIYQRASYANEKRRAWQLLGDKLARLEREALTGQVDNLVQLHA